MFGFDMLVHGVRGDQLPDEDLTEEELEVYGVDWGVYRMNSCYVLSEAITQHPRVGIHGLDMLDLRTI